MTAFSPQLLDELRARIPVSEIVGRTVKLKKAGAEFKGLSPFQNESSPSFTVNDQKGFYHDFSSGKHGDIFSFLMETRGLDFRAAVAECAQMAGIAIPDDGESRTNGGGRPNGGSQEPIELSRSSKREITTAYDYTDVAGTLLYQVCRIEWQDNGRKKKTFMQRRPDGTGHWIWGLSGGEFIKSRDGDWYQATDKRIAEWFGAERRSFPAGVKHGLYRLMELREEIGADTVVYLPEGEKDVETLRGIGLVATTNSGGAKNWTPEHSEALRGLDVVLLLDNDEPGRERGHLLAEALLGIARRTRLVDFSQVWPEAPKGADVTDWIRQREGTAEELEEIVRQAPEWRAPPFVPTMGLRLWADQDRPGQQYDYLVEDLIPERQVVVLMGDTGTGKSFLTFSMAMAVARGVPFLDRRIIKPAGVVWCAYEAAEGAGARMRAYRRHHGLPLEPLPFAALQHPLPLWPNEPNGELLIKEVRGIERAHFEGVPLGMIVVDTYNAATPGASEIDSEVVSRIRTYFRRAVEETGATLLIVGHTNASGKHRGNEQLTNNVDTILKVSMKTMLVGREAVQLKDEDKRPLRTLKVVKQREGQSGDEFDFVLHAIEDGTTNKFGMPRKSCVIVPSEARADNRGRAPTGKGPRLSQERTVILRALQTALDEYGEGTPPMLAQVRAAGVTRVVRAKHWKEVYLQKLPDHDVQPDNTINKRLANASSQFQNLGIIGRENPYVWIVPKTNFWDVLKDGEEGFL